MPIRPTIIVVINKSLLIPERSGVAPIEIPQVENAEMVSTRTMTKDMLGSRMRMAKVASIIHERAMVTMPITFCICSCGMVRP